MDDRPILIAGPTASGKSSVALALAELFPVVIVNADALQVYEGWRILTARPSSEDEARAPHELYGHVGMAQGYSVGHWLREIGDVLKEAREAGRRAVIVGGTGLYFSALTEGLADIPPIPDDVRAAGNKLRRNHGSVAFADVLREHDPALMARIDLANPMRLQRAWEVLEATGRPLSAWQADTGPPLLDLAQTVPVVLKSSSTWLNARIEARFEIMVAEGALEEVSRQLAQGLDFALPSARALGATELAAHLRGDVSLAKACAQATIATRRFAKRQRTWFRSKMARWHSIDIEMAAHPHKQLQKLLRTRE